MVQPHRRSRIGGFTPGDAKIKSWHDGWGVTVESTTVGMWLLKPFSSATESARTSRAWESRKIANRQRLHTARMSQYAGSRIRTGGAPLFSRLSGGAGWPLHRRHTEEEPSMMKWTIRLRWKGQTIEIEIEIGLSF
jgi:hypothetical protein